MKRFRRILFNTLAAISLLLPRPLPACGYDTRANPAKCSECGHELKPATDLTGG